MTHVPGALGALRALGGSVDAAWRELNFRDDALGALAEAKLQDALPAVSFDEIVSWILEHDGWPLQRLNPENSFGQPPISVYESDTLVVQLLVWSEATTSIHEHAFVGAFAVLVGGSLHTRFDFSTRRSWSPRLEVGELTVVGAERLSVGDVRRIQPRAGTLHSLFHLERPSVSLVVRSRSLVAAMPQLSMWPPGLAFDPFHQPALAVRRRMLFRTLFKMAAEGRCKRAVRHVTRTDALDAVMLLLELRSLVDKHERRELVAAIVDAHGEELALLESVVNEDVRMQNLQTRRASITDPDQRLLLALLLNAPDRAHFLALATSCRHGADPVTWTLDTLEALQNQAAAANDDEAGLGIELDAAARYALGAHLEGKSEPELLSAAPAALDKAAIQKACFVLPHMKALTPLFR